MCIDLDLSCSNNELISSLLNNARPASADVNRCISPLKQGSSSGTYHLTSAKLCHSHWKTKDTNSPIIALLCMKQPKIALKKKNLRLACSRIKKLLISGHPVSLREKSGSWRQLFQNCSTNFHQSEHFRNVRGKKETDEIRSHLGKVKMLDRKLRLLAQQSCNATLSSLRPLLFRARSLTQEPVCRR